LNDFFGRLNFGHLRRVAFDDAENAMSVGVDGVTSFASVDDLVSTLLTVFSSPTMLRTNKLEH
jgi:hypothetical protein